MGASDSRWSIPFMQQATCDFAEEVRRRIDSEEPCWFPGLASLLVRQFWTQVHPLGHDAYSTETWIGGTSSQAVLPVPGQSQMVVEPLPAAFHGRFKPCAVSSSAPEVVHAVAGGLARLTPVGAGKAVASLVRSVHCIGARRPGYDCSHSEPSIPFSVFVSFPFGEQHAELRVAESLLHEAMHLQLTLIEQHAPIAGNDAGSAYSPWQQCDRPVHGLLHGLYVFAAVYQWLCCLGCDSALAPEDRAYVDRRSREIETEIRAVSWLPSERRLSDFGRSLSAWLLARFLTWEPAYAPQSPAGL